MNYNDAEIHTYKHEIKACFRLTLIGLAGRLNMGTA